MDYPEIFDITLFMFGRQKRTVPKPEVVGPHRSTNPMFTTPEQLSSWRARVGAYTVTCLFIGIIGYLIYGPLFSINDIFVTGTRLIEPASVKRATENYVNGQRWLILPNRTLWILSANGLAQNLEKQIRQRISVESIVITKQRPHGLTVTINERTPVANWTNGSLIGSVDGQGKIIELRPAADANLPTIRDEGSKIFTVNSSVVKHDVITSWKSLAGYMRQANIEVTEYLIPIPICPEPVIPAAATNSSTATNTNLANSNTNTVAQNANITTVNTNTNVPAPIPCDAEALRYSSQEIHAQLKEGPRVLFDRHSNLEQAVQALKRVLSERMDKLPKSIDVRFGDRVYVQ